MKFIVYVPLFNYDDSHIRAWQAILECEGKKLHLPAVTQENSDKCMKMSHNTGSPILMVEQNGKEKYIGYHYIDLINFLSDNGLMLC